MRSNCTRFHRSESYNMRALKQSPLFLSMNSPKSEQFPKPRNRDVSSSLESQHKLQKRISTIYTDKFHSVHIHYFVSTPSRRSRSFSSSSCLMPKINSRASPVTKSFAYGTLLHPSYSYINPIADPD